MVHHATTGPPGLRRFRRLMVYRNPRRAAEIVSLAAPGAAAFARGGGNHHLGSRDKADTPGTRNGHI
jgi:hypothetical protein